MYRKIQSSPISQFETKKANYHTVNNTLKEQRKLTKSQRANKGKCNLGTCRKRPPDTGKWDTEEQVYGNETNYLAKRGVSDS